MKEQQEPTDANAELDEVMGRFIRAQLDELDRHWARRAQVDETRQQCDVEPDRHDTPGDYGLSAGAVYRARQRELRIAHEYVEHSAATLRRATLLWGNAQRQRRWMAWRVVVAVLALGVTWLWSPPIVVGLGIGAVIFRFLRGMAHLNRYGDWHSNRRDRGWVWRGSRAHIATERWRLDSAARQHEEDLLKLNTATINLINAYPEAGWPLADLCPNAGIREYEKVVRDA